MGGASGYIQYTRGACSILVGKPERQRRLRKHRFRWEYNITIVFNKLLEGQVMDLSDLG
jgi:hypothetical protein